VCVETVDVLRRRKGNGNCNPFRLQGFDEERVDAFRRVVSQAAVREYKRLEGKGVGDRLTKPQLHEVCFEPAIHTIAIPKRACQQRVT